MSFANLTKDGENAATDSNDWAVMSNGPAVAELLGHKKPSDTKVRTIQIVTEAGVVLFDDTVREGKYLSAIWIEAWLTYRNINLVDGAAVEFDPFAEICLMLYMGTQVCRDALDDALELHDFVGKALSAFKDAHDAGAKVFLIVNADLSVVD